MTVAAVKTQAAMVIGTRTNIQQANRSHQSGRRLLGKRQSARVGEGQEGGGVATIT